MWVAGAGPLVLWSAGPLVLSSSAPATNSTLPHQKLLRLPRNLHSKSTKSCTCHEICAPQSSAPATKSALQGPQKSPAPATKSALQGHKVLHLPRNLHFKVHKKVLRLPRNLHSKACAYQWPPTLHFNMCIARSTKYCTCHETLRQASKQARAAHLWIWCAAKRALRPPNPPRATKSALHPRHPRLPRNQYFKVNSPVPNFSNSANMPPLSLYLSIYLPIYVFIDPFIFLSVYHEVCIARSTKYCTCHETLRQASKQARAAHLWIWCAAGGGAAPPPTPPAP